LNNKILIYSNLITKRQEYIFTFIFEEILKLRFEICDDLEHFHQSKLPKFVYSQYNVEGKYLFLKAHSILFEKEIGEIQLDFFGFNTQVGFFKSSKNSFLPFDIFAASFYLISRYEEYLPYKPDEHERFPAKESISSKMGFLEEPIIDNWAISLKMRLLEYFPELEFKNRSFQFLSTIDIDNAYAHLHKGFFRTTMSIIQTAIKRNAQLSDKINVLRGKRKDPYDNYNYLDKVHQQRNMDVIYFILFSKYGKYDKNLSMSNKAFQKLIKRIANKNEIGMHPSYQSNNNFALLKNEKISLEKLIGKPINTSRQHFLKLKIPETYEQLIRLGITSDHSMGYASLAGFRAGTCSPFYFFNLKTDEKTKLKITPFAIMDVCFKDYLKCSPANTLKKIKKIITSIKKVDGLFVSLWHNESLNEALDKKSSKPCAYKTLTERNLNKNEKNKALASDNQQLTWRDVYEQMLNEAKNRN